MVVQGSLFVRFAVGGGVIEGTSAAVANGVTAGELEALLQQGAPAAWPARVARLLPDSVSVVLPPSFAAGPAVALLYARHESESFVSNAIPVVLP
jgi:hypothetical protein